ncbi:Hypothetical predicted protein [Cloeon dipterum]|uniref:Beta-galactosidase n=2 Tax=Cloeon dipterum TaxID=197152 RepID=A0A8S1D6D2_9INSE|nr:Hypothetical predicted protein [Cloeon dipterum]
MTRPSFVLLGLLPVLSLALASREFYIDYDNNQFVKDGAPFKYVSGSFHYFRTPSVYWRDRLRKMKQGGLNAVSTYVEWRSHEKVSGQYDFSGDLDLENFIKIAQEEELLVILRPGPYICAERELGGLPSWLLNVNPEMQLRTRDPEYMGFVRRWFQVLFTRLEPYFYGKDGPIIMVQVENEYGSYFACDSEYLNQLRDIIKSHVGDSAVLFTTDGSAASLLKCGKIDDVYATVDFGPGTNVELAFNEMIKFEPRGPLVNSEFYPGWLDHWGEEHSTVNTVNIIQTLEWMFKYNASVNFYVYYGGTNFGFTSGANYNDHYAPQPTSYDYDAPLTEAGDPTPKYMAIRAAANSYLQQVPSKEVPVASRKGYYGRMNLKFLSSIFDLIPTAPQVNSDYPLSFEELNQDEGFVLYKTVITKCHNDPALLVAKNIGDRGYVFVNKERAGVLSRINFIDSLPVSANTGDELEILVENQGRINYGRKLKDFKGLLSNVTIDNNELKYWKMIQLPFGHNGTELRAINKKISSLKAETQLPIEMIYESVKSGLEPTASTPSIFWAEFRIPNNSHPPLDTFLDMKGWSKGIAFINGFNLGRYWPRVGPQRTLYLPGSLLNANSVNRLVIIEFDRVPRGCMSSKHRDCAVVLSDTAVLDDSCLSNEVK